MADQVRYFNINFSFRGSKHNAVLEREDIGLITIYYILKISPDLDGVYATFLFFFDDICTSSLPDNIKEELCPIIQQKILEYFEDL